MEKFMYETEDSLLLKKVYDRLQDEESRKIYAARSLFSLSDNKHYMDEIVSNMIVSKVMIKALEENKDKKKVLFGAGTWGKAILDFFPEIKWDYIVDNGRAGEEIGGVRINSFDELLDAQDCFIVLAILFKYKEVEKQLIGAGIKKENIVVLGKVADEKQYFDLPVLNLSEEVFIDVGGFNGNTSLQFEKEVSGNYQRIMILEANPVLAEECRSNTSTLHDCVVVAKGAWCESTTLHFEMAGEGSRVVEEADEQIETLTIDELLNGDVATYIKMDIEGAEYNALLGAEQTIRKHKPKLAISIYHKRDDIWKIPVLLLQFNSDYKFYMRTYSFTGNDTVLYAV